MEGESSGRVEQWRVESRVVGVEQMYNTELELGGKTHYVPSGCIIISMLIPGEDERKYLHGMLLYLLDKLCMRIEEHVKITAETASITNKVSKTYRGEHLEVQAQKQKERSDTPCYKKTGAAHA
ncbi:hypothetical protein Tco_1221997 [Tanacetum coccineum]